MKRSAWLVPLLLSFATAAHADEGDEAQRWFDEGQRLFDDGRVGEACQAFQRSVELDRAIGAVINLARCHAAQGKMASAVYGYREAAARARAAGQNERAEGAEQIVEELLPRVSKLRVEVTERHQGLAVRVAGKLMSSAQIDEPLLLDPGDVVVEATAPGRERFETTATVPSAGQVAVVRIPILPSTDDSAAALAVAPTGSRIDGLQITGIVVGSVGVAAAVAGGVLGVLTLGAVSDAENDPALCPDRRCTPAGLDEIDGARSLGIASTILIGVSVAAIGGGVTMLLLGGDGEEASASFDGLKLRF